MKTQMNGKSKHGSQKHRSPSHHPNHPPQTGTMAARQQMACRLLTVGRTTQQVRRALRKHFGVGLGGTEISRLRRIVGNAKGTGPGVVRVAIPPDEHSSLTKVMRGLEARGVGYVIVVVKGEVVELRVKP